MFNALSSASVRHEAGYLISMRTLRIVLFECRKTAQSQIKTSLSPAPLEATARSLTQVQSGAKTKRNPISAEIFRPPQTKPGPQDEASMKY